MGAIYFQIIFGSVHTLKFSSLSPSLDLKKKKTHRRTVNSHLYIQQSQLQSLVDFS